VRPMGTLQPATPKSWCRQRTYSGSSHKENNLKEPSKKAPFPNKDPCCNGFVNGRECKRGRTKGGVIDTDVPGARKKKRTEIGKKSYLEGGGGKGSLSGPKLDNLGKRKRKLKQD